MKNFDAEKALGWVFLALGFGMDVGFALLGKPGAYGTLFYLFAFLIYARKRDEELASLHRATLSVASLRRIASDYEDWGIRDMARYLRDVAGEGESRDDRQGNTP